MVLHFFLYKHKGSMDIFWLDAGIAAIFILLNNLSLLII